MLPFPSTWSQSKVWALNVSNSYGGCRNIFFPYYYSCESFTIYTVPYIRRAVYRTQWKKPVVSSCEFPMYLLSSQAEPKVIAWTWYYKETCTTTPTNLDWGGKHYLIDIGEYVGLAFQGPIRLGLDHDYMEFDEAWRRAIEGNNVSWKWKCTRYAPIVMVCFQRNPKWYGMYYIDEGIIMNPLIWR